MGTSRHIPMQGGNFFSSRTRIIYNFLYEYRKVNYHDIYWYGWFFWWPSFLAFATTLKCENWKIIKDFTYPFMNKHKMSRISDQTIIIYLSMIWLSTFRAPRTTWNGHDLTEDELIYHWVIQDDDISISQLKITALFSSHRILCLFCSTLFSVYFKWSPFMNYIWFNSVVVLE